MSCLLLFLFLLKSPIVSPLRDLSFGLLT